MKLTIYLVLIGFVYMACETVVDIDVPIEERMLVVNGLNNPDSTWRVRVSLSRHILDDVPFKIPDQASVSIIDAASGELVEQLTKSPEDWFYEGNTKPVAGKEYSLRVITSKYGTAESTSVLPLPVSITKIEIDSIPRQPAGGGGPINWEDTFPVKIHFNDPAGVANYYMVSATARSYYLQGPSPQQLDTVWYDYPISVNANDPSLQTDYNFNGPIYFDDRLFDGDARVVTVGLQSYNFYYNNTAQVKIIFSSLSESYYNYATTSNLQHATSGDPFAQPVLVYSNIQNGLGIFGGYSQSVWVVKK